MNPTALPSVYLGLYAALVPLCIGATLFWLARSRGAGAPKKP